MADANAAANLAEDHQEKARPPHPAIAAIETKIESISNIFYGFCFGMVRKEINAVYRFKDWMPVRYRLSLVYTSILLASLAVLFSERVLKNLGADPKVSSPSLCSASTKDDHVATLEDIFARETNFHMARRQYDHTSIVLDALNNDTELYGEVEYACPMEPRTKGDYFLDAIQRGDSDYGDDTPQVPFFPGHCESALELKMKTAREQKCQRQVCVDMEIEFETADIDLDGIGDAWSWFRRGEEGVVTTETVEKTVRGCKEVNVPCPKNDEIEELDGTLRDYLIEQTIRQEQATLHQQKPIAARAEEATSEGISNLMKKGSDIIEKLLNQIDIASSSYVVYLWLSLFFPSPLYVFRSRFRVTAKRYIFGAKKAVFILLVLAIWWGVQYIRSFSVVLEVELYFQNLLKNPCYADVDFLADAARTLDNTCKEIAIMDYSWTDKTTAITSTLEEVKAFEDTCKCDYPCQYLCQIQPDSTDNATTNQLKRLHFADAAEYEYMYGNNIMCASCDADILLPSENATFVANRTLCDDKSHAFVTFLNTSPESEIGWWNLWVESGLLASLLVKTFMANFGVAILHLADCFIGCNGQFEGPPKSQHFESTPELKARCEQNLKMIALQKCIMWAVLANACLINIAVSTFYNGSTGNEDSTSDVGYILLGMSFVLPLLASCYARINRRKALKLRNIAEKEVTLHVVEDELRIEEGNESDDETTMMELKLKQAKSNDPEAGIEVCLPPDS